MRDLLYHFNASVRTISCLGLVILMGIILLQALQGAAVAEDGNRDEFPGRRQGGGTHLILTPSPSPEADGG